jgi:hypothetical protein
MKRSTGVIGTSASGLRVLAIATSLQAGIRGAITFVDLYSMRLFYDESDIDRRHGGP